MTINTWKVWLKGSKLDRSGDGDEQSIRPLWTVDLKDSDAILDWHKKVWSVMETRQNSLTARYLRNRDLYAGLQSPSPAHNRVGTLTDPLSEWGTSKFRIPEIVINHSFELTEQLVSKLSRFSTTVDILPQNTEESDRNNARAAQRFANHIGEVHDLKSIFIEFIRDSKIGGESYVFCDWNENVGDLTPDARKLTKGKRVPLLDEDGTQVIGESGEPLFIEKAPRVGDIEFRHRSVPEVLVQPKKRWKNVEWICEIDLIDVDELRALYPKSIKEIDYAYDSGKRSGKYGDEVGNSVFVYTYWHKSVEWMNSGRKIILCDECVLHNEDNPFSGAPLPCVRLTDIDIQGELHGWSFLNNIAIPQLVLNRLYTLAYRNIALGSHLYWLIPANARVARDKIANSSTVLQYFGVQKPEIATFNTVRPEQFQFIEKIENRMLTVSRVQHTSRGELPPNVEAGVAIQILEEQENQSMTPDIKKVNAAVEKLYSLALGIAGDYFEKGDGRTARILGTEGEFLLEEVEKAKLSGPYDIKVKKATAFSQSKPLLIKEITQLEAMRPGVLSNEEIYDLLDLGDRDKFYDITTAARRTAEFENQRMREGKEISEPTKDEFLLVHWDSHLTEIQTPSFKIQASEKTKEAFENHVIVTELFLVEKAKSNIALAQKLATMEYFPVYYVPDFTIPEILAALQQGQILPALGEVQPPAPVDPAMLNGQTELGPEGEAIPAAPPEEGFENLPMEQMPPGQEPEATGPML